jgi:hypothetical protein
MLRVMTALAFCAIFISFGTASAIAQSTSQKPQSPGEIAAVSRLLAEKHENCRVQAMQQKLNVFRRHSFIRACMNKKP